MSIRPPPEPDMASHDPSDATQSLLPPSDLLESGEPLRRTEPVLLRLYISHWLSTWNSRMFEFGSVLFLASIFPGTLLYASIYALVRSLSAVVLSSWLGSVVDRSNRLKTIRHSIIWQRLPVAASCACFILLLNSRPHSTHLTWLLFTAVALLACAEKLAASANTVSVERDWAVVISDALQYPRQDLNASMRRIDLICKLLAPVVISFLDGFSTTVAIWTVLGVNLSCVVVEYIAIAQVYKAVPELERHKTGSENEAEDVDTSLHGTPHRSRQSVVRYIQNITAPWKDYIASRVFLASFSLSLLYLTVLSFGTTMVTYLLHTGFSALEVSLMRIGAVVAELSGTWAAPCIMDRIGPIRSGLWFLNWQFICLAAAVAGFAFLEGTSQVVAISLIVGVALSRIGLWGFDLSVQFLVQEGVEEHERARFSSTEMALQNTFELLSFATTIVFPRPEQFKYPVYISYGAIGVAAIFFAAYVRRERGHLLHTSKCFGGDKGMRPLSHASA
ncbi:Ferroporti-1 [Aspergillus ambiguus]|uniref:putative iron-regulated transporter n=1 Tax=Aspergillus ambiguus TaxID=176160 RepID=UPI003CCE5212